MGGWMGLDWCSYKRIEYYNQCACSLYISVSTMPRSGHGGKAGAKPFPPPQWAERRRAVSIATSALCCPYFFLNFLPATKRLSFLVRHVLHDDFYHHLLLIVMISPFKNAGPAVPPSPRTSRALNGLYGNGVWHCNCDPRLPAARLQTKNHGKNHGRWCTKSPPMSAPSEVETS